MALPQMYFATIFILAIFSLSPAFVVAEGDNGSVAVEVSSVLILDSSNFSNTVMKHHFMVVEFYAPWCQHCKKLAPEYEKAALALSKHDPPIILAKVDATEEQNKELASNYDVNGYPTIMILKSEGKIIQDYKGPREAEGMIEYLKKQVGPASAEIKVAEDASNLINEQNVFIVGIFREFSGEEFTNFTIVAEKLRSDYDFRHTLDDKILPHGEPTKNLPIVRLFKPFDELFVDFKDFDVDALEGFIISSSVPIITTYSKDPKNYPYLSKFFDRPTVKVMLFLNFSNEHIDVFKSKYYETAEHNKGKNISFLIGDLNSSKNALEFYGLKEDQVPLLFIQGTDGQKYLKPHLQPNQISVWLNEYKDGLLSPFFKSLPIPETNDEPVKIVVADSLHDMVFASGKNVLLEFFSPKCGFCTELAPILDEVAISFQNDVDVLIAKMDATANGFPNLFDVKGFPMMYLYTASGKIVKFDGYRTSEDIINFIQENRDVKPSYSHPTKDEL